MMSPVGSHPVESSQVKSSAVNLEANLGGVDTVDGAVFPVKSPVDMGESTISYRVEYTLED